MEYWSVAAHFQHSSTPTLQYSEGLFYEAQGLVAELCCCHTIEEKQAYYEYCR